MFIYPPTRSEKQGAGSAQQTVLHLQSKPGVGNRLHMSPKERERKHGMFRTAFDEESILRGCGDAARPARGGAGRLRHGWHARPAHPALPPAPAALHNALTLLSPRQGPPKLGADS